jgi:tripartite-type tricarboxylate transporter receptor subunit TctC
MTHRWLAAALAASFPFALPGAASAQDGAAFFKGRTAEWIVATAPGGNFDYYARLIARHMPKHIPGLSFVVVNRPGAGHIIGTNLIYVAKPDGLTLGSFTTNLIYAQILKRKGIRFDLARMSWIGKAAAETRVLTVGANSEFRTFDDMIASKRDVKFAASGVGSGTYTEAYMVGAAFNLPIRVIPGFGNTDAQLAIMRGEIDAQMAGIANTMASVKAGQAKILLQIGTEAPGVPNGADYARTPEARTIVNLLSALSQVGRVTAGPPDMVPDRLAALRAAYRAALASPELRAEAAKAGNPIDPAVGDDVATLIKGALDQPPEVVALLEKLASLKPELVKHKGPVTRSERDGRMLFLTFEGKEVSAKLSGSRTKVTIGGKPAKRKDVKAGMTCTFAYPRPGAEAANVDCDG